MSAQLHIVDTAGTAWDEEYKNEDDARDDVDTIVENGSIEPPYIDTVTLIVDDKEPEELYRYEPEDDEENEEDDAE